MVNEGKGRRLISPPFSSDSGRDQDTQLDVVWSWPEWVFRQRSWGNEDPDRIIYRTNSVPFHAKPSRRVAELSRARTSTDAIAGGATSLKHSLSSAIGVRGIASVRSLRVSRNSDWRPHEGSEAEVSFLENTLSSF